MKDNQNLICPFCGENDFDKFGLKQHLIKWCIEFTEVEASEILRIAINFKKDMKDLTDATKPR